VFVDPAMPSETLTAIVHMCEDVDTGKMPCARSNPRGCKLGCALFYKMWTSIDNLGKEDMVMDILAGSAVTPGPTGSPTEYHAVAKGSKCETASDCHCSCVGVPCARVSNPESECKGCTKEDATELADDDGEPVVGCYPGAAEYDCGHHALPTPCNSEGRKLTGKTTGTGKEDGTDLKKADASEHGAAPMPLVAPSSLPCESSAACECTCLGNGCVNIPNPEAVCGGCTKEDTMENGVVGCHADAAGFSCGHHSLPECAGPLIDAGRSDAIGNFQSQLVDPGNPSTFAVDAEGEGEKAAEECDNDDDCHCSCVGGWCATMENPESECSGCTKEKATRTVEGGVTIAGCYPGAREYDCGHHELKPCVGSGGIETFGKSYDLEGGSAGSVGKWASHLASDDDVDGA